MNHVAKSSKLKVAGIYRFKTAKLQTLPKLAGESQIKIARSPLLPHVHKKERKFLSDYQNWPRITRNTSLNGQDLAHYKQEKSKKLHPSDGERLTLTQDCADECSFIYHKHSNTTVFGKADYTFV